MLAGEVYKSRKQQRKDEIEKKRAEEETKHLSAPYYPPKPKRTQHTKTPSRQDNFEGIEKTKSFETEQNISSSAVEERLINAGVKSRLKQEEIRKRIIDETKSSSKPTLTTQGRKHNTNSTVK